jgi:hypothetical protein
MAFNAKTQRRKDAKVKTDFPVSPFAASRLCAFAFVHCGLLVLALVSIQSLVAADPPPSQPKAAPPKSLDAQLLDDLDADLLKGLPGSVKPGIPAMPAAPGTKPPAGEDLGEAGAATNPLAIVGERMREVQRRIAGRDTSETTQTVQKQIEADLAKLIEQAKQQCAACNKSGSGQGQQAGNTGGNPTPAPPRDSTNRVEQGAKEAVETADVKDVLRRFWGHLPDKIRDEMQSSLSEEFLPKYERVIEDYYRRLAEDPRVKP